MADWLFILLTAFALQRSKADNDQFPSFNRKGVLLGTAVLWLELMVYSYYLLKFYKENKQFLCEKACVKPLACKNDMCIKDDEAIQGDIDASNAYRRRKFILISNLKFF